MQDEFDDISHYHFELPDELIAAFPLPERPESRLLVVDRNSGSFRHQKFREIADFFEPGDLLVANNSRVIPARVFGKKPSGGRVEILVVEALGTSGEDVWTSAGEREFLAMCKASKRPQIGQFLEFDFGVVEVTRDHEGLLTLRGSFELGLLHALESHGTVPLPPYIVKKRQDAPPSELNDDERYQTVYAEKPGSVAAPTAGLHFDQTLLQDLIAKGVELVHVTLDVGPGTFRPVSTAKLSEHVMHYERYTLSDAASKTLSEAKAKQRRVFAVGTTTTRVLESEARLPSPFEPGTRKTALFLRPGNPPHYVDHLITNFHLPQSTLLALVASFTGVEMMQEAYRIAIAERYRFYSYGDAMLIL